MSKTWEDVVDKRIEGSEELPVYHQIEWWIERKLTLDEWAELDRLQYEVFEKLDIPVSGVAGPIPELGEK